MPPKAGPKGHSIAEQVRHSIVDLKEARKELDVVDDGLSAIIPQVESLLTSLRVGVPIKTVLSTDEETGETDTLEFRKWGDRWRLMVCENAIFHEGESKLLAECDRNTRAYALELLPTLLREAATHIQKAVERRRSIRAELDEVMAVLAEEVKVRNAEAHGVADKPVLPFLGTPKTKEGAK